MMTLKGRSPAIGSWHVGEVLKLPSGHMLTLTVDGHEYQALLAALTAAGIEIEYDSVRLTPVL